MIRRNGFKVGEGCRPFPVQSRATQDPKRKPYTKRGKRRRGIE